MDSKHETKAVTEFGIDPICDVLLMAGAESVTRAEWIDYSFCGDPPEPWTAELEELLPEPLQDFAAISQATSAD